MIWLFLVGVLVLLSIHVVLLLLLCSFVVNSFLLFSAWFANKEHLQHLFFLFLFTSLSKSILVLIYVLKPPF